MRVVNARFVNERDSSGISMYLRTSMRHELRLGERSEFAVGLGFVAPTRP